MWWLGEQTPLPRPIRDAALDPWLDATAIGELAGVAQQRIERLYTEVARRAGAARTLATSWRSTAPTPVPELMLELYPGAREVMLVRDFRDMIASMFAYNEKRGRQGFRRDRATSDRDYILNDVGVSVAALADAWARRSDTAHLLRYEDLVLRPEETVQALLAHLGLDAGPGAVEPMLGSLLAPRQRIGGPPHGRRPAGVDRPLAARPLGRSRGCLRRGLRPASGDLRVRAGVSGETVLLGGSVAQRPGSGGHTWVFLQYLLGLQRLGLRRRAGGPARAGDVPRPSGRGRATSRTRGTSPTWPTVMERFGLGDRWAVLHDGGRARRSG